MGGTEVSSQFSRRLIHSVPWDPNCPLSGRRACSLDTEQLDVDLFAGREERARRLRRRTAGSSGASATRHANSDRRSVMRVGVAPARHVADKERRAHMVFAHPFILFLNLHDQDLTTVFIISRAQIFYTVDLRI